jgi:carboxypeptidase family protein
MQRMMRMVLAAQLLLAGSALFAQNIASSIVGHVTDPSGAALPEAQVTVRNMGTSAVRTTATGSDGSYAVPEILAGTYEVTIAKQGFTTYRAIEVRVLSTQTRRVDANLSVSAVQQSVEVKANATPVTTDSMAISDSVSQTQLENLPTGLQTVDAFIALAPGVQAPTSGDATNPQIGGGSHWGSVNFNVNGVSNNDPGNSGGATVQGVGLLVMPPPSSIQELHVQTNGMDAQYRDHASVSLVTKQGTNDFHFLAYEYLQNPILNANTYVNNATGIARANDHLNQFGGNIGGPIVKNKLFFFADYSGYRHNTSGTAQQVYPSAAMRNGDFGALCSTYNSSGVCSAKGGVQLYNPFTGSPFANNQIPTSMFAPQSLAYLKYLPVPTDATSPGLPSGKTNYFTTIPITQDVDGEDVRVDYNLRPSDQLFGVFAQRLATPWNSFANWPPSFGQLRYGYKNFTASASETHVFNSSTINDFRVGWADYATKFSGLNQDVNPKDLFPQMPDTFFRGLPQINATGYGNGGVLIHDYGTGLYTPRWDWEFTDNFTHVQGKHNFQAGFDETGYKIESRKGSSTGDPPTGRFSFTGQWTGNHGWPGQPTSNGNAFADFLLGTISSDATAWQGLFASAIYSRDWGAYFQDTWQATSGLTLILGLRYEYQSPWAYRQPTTTTFDLNTGKMVLSENSTTPVLLPNMDAAQFAAYQWETSQSLGWPQYYVEPDHNNFSPRLGFAWRPLGNSNTVLRGGYGVYYNFQPGFVGSRTDGQNTPWLLSTSQPFTTALPAKPATPFMPDLTFANPFGSSKGEIVSPNPSISFLQRDFQNAMSQEWNLTLEHGFGAWVVRTSYIGNHTEDLPYNGGEIDLPDVQQPNVTKQKQLPYQPFSSIHETRSLGIQNFNQAQVGVKRSFGNGLSFQSEYEFTRSLDDVAQGGGPQQPLHPMLDYGNSDAIRRHWLVFNYVYQLPFGRGRHWLNGGNGFTDAVLGGWSLSGITTYGTGTPFNVTFAVPTKYNTSWFGGRVDRVPGVPLYAGQQSGHDVIDGVQWFNPDAFAPPQPWAWGNAARNMLFGPGYTNWDISAQKSFAVTERMKLGFRADFFDAFNHFNLNNPNATLADTRDGGTPNANTGQVLGGDGNRIIQLGLTLRY